jgi:hypothetical protein
LVSNSPLRKIIFIHHSFGSKALNKKELMESSNQPGIVANAGKAANWRVDFKASKT